MCESWENEKMSVCEKEIMKRIISQPTNRNILLS
jgi:hypothetical protein